MLLIRTRPSAPVTFSTTLSARGTGWRLPGQDAENRPGCLSETEVESTLLRVESHDGLIGLGGA